MKTKLSVDDIDLSFAAHWTPKEVEAAIVFSLGHEDFGNSLLNPQWRKIAQESVEKGEPWNECVGNCSVSQRPPTISLLKPRNRTPTQNMCRACSTWGMMKKVNR